MTTTRKTKAISRRWMAVPTLALLALSAAGAPAAAQDADPRLPTVELPAGLERVLRDYEAAWAAGDGVALADLFTADGVIRRRSWLQGREAIRERYDAVAAGPLRLRAVEFGAGEATAYIVGAYGYGEEAATRDAGVFLLALERGGDGRWLIAADLDHGIPPG